MESEQTGLGTPVAHLMLYHVFLAPETVSTGVYAASDSARGSELTAFD